MCKDFGAAERIKAEINNQIWYALKRNDIAIPFPIREVSFAHIERAHQAKVAAETQAVIEEELARVPVMAALSAEERNLLASRVRVLPFGAGETVVWEGEQGDSMYIIHTGACEILKDDGHGSSSRVAAHSKGRLLRGNEPAHRREAHRNRSGDRRIADLSLLTNRSLPK